MLSPVAYKIGDIQKYNNRAIIAGISIVGSIALAIVLGCIALKYHQKIQADWEQVMTNRALGIDNTALYLEIKRFTLLGWSYFGGVITSSALALTACGFLFYSIVMKEKTKTYFQRDPFLQLQ